MKFVMAVSIWWNCNRLQIMIISSLFPRCFFPVDVNRLRLPLVHMTSCKVSCHAGDLPSHEKIASKITCPPSCRSQLPTGILVASCSHLSERLVEICLKSITGNSSAIVVVSNISLPVRASDCKSVRFALWDLSCVDQHPFVGFFFLVWQFSQV